MKELFKYLNPLKIRINLKLIINTVLCALAAALCLNAVLVLYSKFVYLYGTYDICIAVLALVLCLAVVFACFFMPSDYKVVRIADSLGFKERFVTAYEILHKSEDKRTSFERMAVSDAVDTAKTADFKALYSLKSNKYFYIAPVIAAIILLLAVIIPIEPSKELQAQQELHQMLDEALEDMKQDVDTSNLTKKQKSELKKELNTVKKQLSKVDNKQTAVNKIMESQARLKKISVESENKQLKAIGEQLSQNEATQELGELLKSGNIEEFNEQLKQINNSLANMTDEEIKQFGEALKKAAQNSELDADTKQLLDNLADTMQQELTDEQLESISAGLNELSDKIDELAKDNEDIREAVDKLNSDMAKTSDKLGAGGSTQQGQKQSTQQGQGTQQGGAAQQGQGTQQGGAAQQGQGTQQGTAQGGSAKGTGSVQNANVYTDKAKGYADYDAELNQNGTDKTGDKYKTSVNGENGEVVPYTDVYGEYKQEAMNNIEQGDVPYGVKDIVKDYFSSLE